MSAPRPAHRHDSGMTVLELMIVLAIIGMGAILARSGFRMLTKADLVEDSNELGAVMRRASQLAVEHGELHRVVFDLGTGKVGDPQGYVVEVCHGAVEIARNESVKPDETEKARAIERGQLKLATLPKDAFAAGDPEEAARRATAIAGAHVGDRSCIPATDSFGTYIGDTTKAGWSRKLRTPKGIHFKEIWVQHKDESTTKGQVAIYFWPTGSSEKAVIEMTDDSEIFTLVVTGLTGQVSLRDGAPKSVDDLMLKNMMGDKDAKREDSK